MIEELADMVHGHYAENPRPPARIRLGARKMAELRVDLADLGMRTCSYPLPPETFMGIPIERVARGADACEVVPE